MLKEFAKHIVEVAEPHYKEHEGQLYSDKPLIRVHHNPKADPIKLSTLTSLVDYLRAGLPDTAYDRLIIHVKSPTTVSVYSELDEDRRREHLAEVNAQIPTFAFDQYVGHEAFCIGLQSKFIDSADRALLLKFAGTVEAGSVAEYGDDGVSQKATVKTGIASKGEALIPSPVILQPFRTFIEVEQPVSAFIFRMQPGKYDNVQCALYEADGGAWKNNAMNEIKAYLGEALNGDDPIDPYKYIILS